MDDVAVFGSALSKSQLLALFSAANGGVVNFAPLIEAGPVSLDAVTGTSAQFQVRGGGPDPLSFQWQAGASGSSVFTNLSDVGNVSGSATATLTLTDLTLGNAADYRIILTNPYGSTTSSVATLTVSLPQNFITAYTEGSSENWSGAFWQANGTGPFVSPIAGNTYEAQANGNALGNSALNTRVRVPNQGGVTPNTFPGASLTLDTNTELRMKNGGLIGSFPGLGGNPGLIFNGGAFSIADQSGLHYLLAGVI
jgi:hypothetical protein